MADKDDRITRIYSNFRGVDFRGNEINLVRSPDCLNVWKDYRETESIRTRPSVDIYCPFTDAVYGIFFYGEEMLVHSGGTLYKLKYGKKTALYSGLRWDTSNSFIYDNIFYFKDGLHYLQYDGETIKDVVGYIPTTTIARKPMGGGTKYEDVNMLSAYRKNSFLADGVSFSFFLDVMNIDEDYVPEVTVKNKKVFYEVTCRYADDDTEHKVPYFTKTNTVLEFFADTVDRATENEVGNTFTGETVYCYDEESYCCFVYSDAIASPEEYEVDYEQGKITFSYLPPDSPLTDGQDNVVVKFKKAVPKYEECIEKCTMLQVFDNRVFFSGNPDYPNMVWNSSLNDPSYVSDLDYYKEGMDNAAVKGLVAGNNALWVFREPSDANTTVFYHTPSIDDEYGKVYPSAHSSITTGCIGKAINFNDDIVFFSERGMEGINGDVTTEQAIAHRSSLVDRKLINEIGGGMVLAEWEGYLLVFTGRSVYLADSRAMFQNENHYEYEWFYWQIEQSVICATVKDGVLYLGTSDGIYHIHRENKSDVWSYWTTPLDKFKYPHKQKTTNKRGCVAEATGDILVFAKTDSTNFEVVGFFENVTDYFACRIKRKKFKDIQLRFYSNTRFSLETATLECFIGGYIKR